MKYLVTLPALCVSLVLLSCLPSTQTEAKPLMVNTRLAGIGVQTSVDSELARDIILWSAAPDPNLLPVELEDAFSCGSDESLPNTTMLERISRNYSTDSATALLIHCLAANPLIAQSQALFLTELEQTRNEAHQQVSSITKYTDQYSVLFVPGWGYLSNSQETGADLRRPREILTELGFDTHLLEIQSNGSVEENARIVVDELLHHLQGNKKLILVSASSGGPTIAEALRDERIARQPQLVGWLNICGVMNGSPVIDRFLGWPGSLLLRIVSLFEGWEYDDLLSLSRARSRPRYAGFQPPAQMTVLNYIGIPFSGQVSSMGKQFYHLLKKQGPNDGLTLVTEALVPGYTIMALGVDHFVANDPEIDLKTRALLRVMFTLIDDSQSGLLTVSR